jgi:hypothetical protein
MGLPRFTPQIAILVLAFSSGLTAQTTQGLISGRLLNSVTGRPIAGAGVVATGATVSEGRTQTDAYGYYYLPLLSPSVYRVRVTAEKYQSQEIQELTLAVAARLDIDFRLRPLNDVWEAGQYNSVFLPGSRTIVTFFGPDVDPSRSGSFEAQKGRSGALESTVSSVIDSGQISNVPLLGRDVYTLLVTEPGVTADAASARGLGLAINGTRPQSSNYLMDGVENNNYLLTGPLVTVAPEAVQEYRVSTNNFSTEYGRTAGFLANAITRSGSNQFHGTGYFYIKNQVLNANGFQENLANIHSPSKEIQPGFVVGGPILHDRLFFSSTYEHDYNRSFEAPVQFTFPNTPVFLGAVAVAGRRSNDLLTRFPSPVNYGQGITDTATLAPPVTDRRMLGVQRLDQTSRDGKNRIMGRLLFSRIDRPDFIWTPYPDFVSVLNQNTWALGGSYLRQIHSNLTNEARLSFSSDDLHWNRPHPEIPTLVAGNVTLPGSPAFYAYKNVNRSQEILDNVIWARGRHLVTAGAGMLFRHSEGYLTAGEDGEYIFSNAVFFGLDRPSYFSASLARQVLPTLAQPDFNRDYSYRQGFAFVQDTFKITSRLTANYGLRYEYLGAPSNVGAAKDLLLVLGSGATRADQLANATFPTPGSGNQQLFSTDKRDWAVRLGASYDLTGRGKTVLRGAYGIFYDRPYDNLWENLRNNSIVLPLLTVTGTADVLTPVLTQFANLKQPILSDFPAVVLVNPDFKNGRIQSYFAGIEHRFTDSFMLQVNGLGTYGRRLVTTDVENRAFSTLNPGGGRYTSVVPDVSYIDGLGYSDYNALTARFVYRTSRAFFQAAYTWSHTIDVQGDALAGDFFNLTFTANGNGNSTGRASFTKQFDPSFDRASSDFDQRQNLVLHGYWTPAPLFPNSKLSWITRDWNFGTLIAIRSGFPYSIVGATNANPGQGYYINNRPNLIDPSMAQTYRPVTGGVALLNPADFTDAANSQLGNLGRNAFTGPGFYHIDMTAGRSFPLRWLGEGARINFRADAFNLLNHANLGNPDGVFGSVSSPNPDFGVAQYGHRAKANFALSPLDEGPRQIQLSVRVEF